MWFIPVAYSLSTCPSRCWLRGSAHQFGEGQVNRIDLYSRKVATRGGFDACIDEWRRFCCTNASGAYWAINRSHLWHQQQPTVVPAPVFPVPHSHRPRACVPRCTLNIFFSLGPGVYSNRVRHCTKSARFEFTVCITASGTGSSEAC